MTRLWLLQQSVEGLETYMRLADRSASGSLVANLADVLGSVATPGEPPIRPQLAIPDEGFDLDLFEEGVIFASGRLIEAMALPPGMVQIGEVDDGDCSADARRMGYRTLRLLARADALDHSASDGGIVDWIDQDGTVRSEWLLAAPEPNRPSPRARWRGDFEPPTGLFLVNGTSWRAATEALAARVMTSGAVGIDFVDPIASAAIGDLVTRPA